MSKEPKRPKLVFGVMSAVAKAATVEQLARSLAPHRVVIHHDFSQQPDFRIDAPNAQFVPDPLRTGYGGWPFPAGVLHLVRHCLAHVDFDYFQLLTPACLPIKPVAAFEQYIERSFYDANSEAVDVTDRDTMMTFAHRLYAPYQSWGRSLLGASRKLYFGDDALQEEIAGVARLTRPASKRSLPPLAWLGWTVTRFAQRGWLGVKTPVLGVRPTVGGAWFGANREACEYLVRRTEEPALLAYFQRMNDGGEMVFPSLLASSSFAVGPLNTFVSPYNGWHPRWLEVDDVPRLAKLPHFFARKFPDDPNAPVRLKVLEQLVMPAARPETV